MNLLELLDNVVCSDHILSFLPVNDLLRLRSICKLTKTISENFIRTNKVDSKEILAISLRECEEDKTAILETFLKKSNYMSTSLPVRSNVRIADFKQLDMSDALSASLRQYLDSFGPNITHLTLFNFPLLSPYPNSIPNFFESFPNVTDLALIGINLNYEGTTARRPKLDAGRGTRIATCFKELKRLAFPYYDTESSRSKRLKIISFIEHFLKVCISGLEQLELPFRYEWMDDYATVHEITRLTCWCLFSAPKLKLVDLDGGLIQELLKPSAPVTGSIENMVSVINTKVMSIRSPQVASFLLELPNLEDIHFDSMDVVLPPNVGYSRNFWPKLKEMSAVYSSNRRTEMSVQQLWNFMFVGIERKYLAKLSIYFYKPKKVEPVISTSRAMDIVRSCPNLKVLHMSGKGLKSPAINLPELWKGLPLLEEIYLDNILLEDTDFIGENADNPVFVGLKHLKELEISGTMLRITDNWFGQVLYHMPLKSLSLNSQGTVRSASLITLTGIMSLHGGKFANSIERLSLTGLKLSGLSSKKLKIVESHFRSAQVSFQRSHKPEKNGDGWNIPCTDALLEDLHFLFSK